MAKPANPTDATAVSGPGTTEAAAERALVKAPVAVEESVGSEMNSVVYRIPIELDVAVPIRNFRVRNLLALEKGRVIESLWIQGEDLPLAAPGAQLAWSEFEVVDQKLAVRITRLA